MIHAEGNGLQVSRYNAARAPGADFNPYAIPGENPFGWRNQAASLPADLRERLCSGIEDWPYLPPDE